ncbi:MAG: O-antigen ligase family protein [Candidatus Moranbacteria bacterium]|nr:O-antigen ligase family protein [Candidatus Moranbacteria bacterium]
MDRLTKYSDRLFFLFVLLLPLQTVYLLREPMIGGAKWQYGTIGIFASALLLATAVMIAAIGRSRQAKAEGIRDPFRGLISEPLPRVALILFVLWAFLSPAWAEDRALALYGALTILLAADAFVMGRDLTRRGKGGMIRDILILGAVLQALVGIGQFVTQETFSSALLGTASHPAWAAGTSVLKNGSGRWFRAYGTFPHPNVYGLFVAVGLFLVVHRIVGMRDKVDARRHMFHRAVLIAALPVLSLGLLVSFSRSAWAGFVVGTTILFWRAVQDAFHFHSADRMDALGKSVEIPGSRVKPGMTGKYAFAGIVAVVVSMAMFSWILRGVVFPRFDGAVVAQEGSVADRKTTYRDAWRVIGESPIVGAGMWNSTAALIRLDPERPVWDVQPAHDVPLLVLADLGIPGLLFLFALVIGSLVTAARRKNTAALAMFLVFLPSLFLDHFLWDSVTGLLLLAVSFGMMSDEVST